MLGASATSFRLCSAGIRQLLTLTVLARHIEVTPEHNGNLFFWHFQNRHIANKQRTVIWLNGGPGCSSEDGALMEIGPYRLKDDHTLEYNDGSWNEFANVMFVDNPVGTGYSYVNTDSYVRELDEMANQFVTFLEKWFALFPEYENDDVGPAGAPPLPRPETDDHCPQLYLAGESYAGQHIPYIAKAILARNKLPASKQKWKLSGLLIGNGWISPPEQYEAYLQFAYAKDLVKKGSEGANKLEIQHRICMKDLAVGEQTVDHSSCEGILRDLLRETLKDGPNGKECINMYDVRLTDSYPSCGMNWPPDLVHVTPYLRRQDVLDALHVDPNKNTGWTECNGAVGSYFRAAKSKPSIVLLPDLLAEMPIVLFSGAEDLICNHLGTEAFISNMQWSGGKGFETSPGTWAPRRDWTFEGEHAGFWQEARNLTYVLFYNSSHMVPFDYARRTRDMLDRFMGVDISSIGGVPTDSRLDGEKGPETTVGGAAGNGTAAQEAEKLNAAKWQAYRKSGEIVLVIVVIAAGLWGWYIWRDRRKRNGYRGLAGGDAARRNGRIPTGERIRGGLESFRQKMGGDRGRDVEAQDFDEGELDDLHVATPTDAAHDERYSVGGDSEDEHEHDARREGEKTQGNGQPSAG